MPESGNTTSPRTAKKIFILLSLVLFVAVVLWFCDRNFRRDARHLDFRAFYAAGQMVADGAGGRLYDMEAQREYQRRTIPDLRQEVYPFPYPPATALLYWPLTWVPLRAAYDLWCLVSVTLLALSLELLRRSLMPAAKVAWTLPLSLVYIPVGATLVNGQTSVFVLAVFVVAFVLALRARDFAAGVVLAVALVKFNFVLPLILVAAVERKYRLVAGFFLGAAVFAGACMMVAGTGFLPMYWRFLTSYSAQTGTITAFPQAMPNLRGLLFMGLRHEASGWLLLAVSVPVLWLAVSAARRTEAAFAAALAAAVLLSYHANLHDLTLLILPAFVAIARSGWRSFAGGIAAFILLPPLLLILMVTHTLALAAIPVVLLLYAISHLGVDAENPLAVHLR